jgi:predicted HicB family RNase H-like nuclease
MAKDKATLNIDPKLHRELKVEAAKQGLKISDLAERFLREGLKKIQ